MDRPDQGHRTSDNAPAGAASPPASDSLLLASLGLLSLNTPAAPPTQAQTATQGVPNISNLDEKPTAPIAAGPSHAAPDLSHAPPPPLAGSPPATSSSRTAVLFQPACALHRYVRNHDIGTIVERPQRLRAVKTGVAAAWARLEERHVASGGARWTPPVPVTASSGADELDDLLKGLSLTGAAGSSDVKGKGKAREVVGGPFDILSSSAMMRIDNRALRLVHPSPNRAPDDKGEGDGWSTVSSDSSPPLEPNPASSPSRQTRQASRPSSPTKRSAKPAPRPWPAQLQDLCRRSSSAILVEPFSEIPPHLPQGDLYLCQESEQAIFGALGAVCEGVDRIVERREGCDRAFVAIRPPGHHCGEANPQGFCFVNNVAVAAAHAHVQHGINRVVILDIDLHHGNGTQELVYRTNAEAQRILAPQARATPAASPRKSTSPRKAAAPPAAPAPEPPQPLQIMYGSLHDIWSYPCEDGDPSLVSAASLSIAGGHGQWLSNVHLEPFTSEEQFHHELYPRYREGLIGRAEEFCRRAGGEGDKTLVIVSAGFDASEHESPGMSRHKRNVPTSFYRRFALDAVSLAAAHAGGKVLGVLEGGYSDRALASGTAAFLTGLVGGGEDAGVPPQAREREDAWWAEPHLKKLEKACSVGKARRGVPAGALIGADTFPSSADPWLARAVDIFSRIEEGAVLPSSSSTGATTTTTTTSVSQSGRDKAALQPSAPRQLRERKVRHNYAGLDDGSTPMPSPVRHAAATAPAAAAAATTLTAQVKREEAVVPALVPPVPVVAPEGDAALQQPVPMAKPAVRFTWKQGGFGGEPRS